MVITQFAALSTQPGNTVAFGPAAGNFLFK